MNYQELVQQWQNKNIKTACDLDTELENFRIIFAYNSNAIENPNTTYHDTREIFENGKVSSFTGDLRTLFEIQNQKECYDWIKDKIIAKEPISINLIKEIHEKLMHGCYDETRFAKGERPGEFKHHEYVTGDNVGAYATDVEAEIQALCDEVNQFGSIDVLKAAAYFHLKFESIHPFADGNGRVGRTLTNYFLMINNYPPTIIYDEDKESYYMALAIYDHSEKIDAFEEFLKVQSLKTWARTKSPSETLPKVLENISLFDEYMIKVDKLVRNNEEPIRLFKLSLTGLADKTTKRHLNNIDTFVNHYCADLRNVNFVEGIKYVDEFLGDYVIHKFVCCSADSLRQMVTSIKKFYKCMLEHELISIAAYEDLCYLLKDCLSEWCEECEKYN